ncbi:hypothetical protein GCM10007301_12220 [Azorhizobium oxalatiphilum]|uniref:Transmembrane protein n=1 Tax=Azorhizobium oxalatiphilum TaxID=980631 RepID=A0A917BTW2_9HYPH|nr:hypothetical protein [Azorhizobium oxalatiphilum]GGF54277.1 hypothetical protein GCM10007301_12220 [Azorhizobium oxalatiphilum]
MSWFFLVVAGLGLGLVFRVPAVLALGTGLFVASVAAQLYHGTSWGTALLSAVVYLVVLEVAYLVGLLLRPLLYRILPGRADRP